MGIHRSRRHIPGRVAQLTICHFRKLPIRLCCTSVRCTIQAPSARAGRCTIRAPFTARLPTALDYVDRAVDDRQRVAIAVDAAAVVYTAAANYSALAEQRSPPNRNPHSGWYWNLRRVTAPSSADRVSAQSLVGDSLDCESTLCAEE